MIIFVYYASIFLSIFLEISWNLIKAIKINSNLYIFVFQDIYKNYSKLFPHRNKNKNGNENENERFYGKSEKEMKMCAWLGSLGMFLYIWSIRVQVVVLTSNKICS